MLEHAALPSAVQTWMRCEIAAFLRNCKVRARLAGYGAGGHYRPALLPPRREPPLDPRPRLGV
jgi:hypothetical protein